MTDLFARCQQLEVRIEQLVKQNNLLEDKVITMGIANKRLNTINRNLSRDYDKLFNRSVELEQVINRYEKIIKEFPRG